MPIFSYRCESCGEDVERITAFAARDEPMQHGTAFCGGTLKRHGVELFSTGKPSFQTMAITANGQHVAGHFGKSARSSKGWHRP